MFNLYESYSSWSSRAMNPAALWMCDAAGHGSNNPFARNEIVRKKKHFDHIRQETGYSMEPRTYSCRNTSVRTHNQKGKRLCNAQVKLPGNMKSRALEIVVWESASPPAMNCFEFRLYIFNIFTDIPAGLYLYSKVFLLEQPATVDGVLSDRTETHWLEALTISRAVALKQQKAMHLLTAYQTPLDCVW